MLQQAAAVRPRMPVSAIQGVTVWEGSGGGVRKGPDEEQGRAQAGLCLAIKADGGWRRQEVGRRGVQRVQGRGLPVASSAGGVVAQRPGVCACHVL